MPATKMEELSEQIASLTKAISSHITAEGLKEPGSIDGPQDFPALPMDLMIAREKLLESTEALNDIVLGPAQKLRNMCAQVCIFEPKSTTIDYL